MFGAPTIYQPCVDLTTTNDPEQHGHNTTQAIYPVGAVIHCVFTSGGESSERPTGKALGDLGMVQPLCFGFNVEVLVVYLLGTGMNIM